MQCGASDKYGEWEVRRSSRHGETEGEGIWVWGVQHRDFRKEEGRYGVGGRRARLSEPPPKERMNGLQRVMQRRDDNKDTNTQ